MSKFAANQRTTIALGPTRRLSLATHTRHCSICKHPQCAEIEADFLDWVGPREIAREYNLGSHTTVYRHAHALGLFAKRERRLRFALGRLIELAGEVKPTGASIVSAIRLMAKLNEKERRTQENENLARQDSPLASSAECESLSPKAPPHRAGPEPSFHDCHSEAARPPVAGDSAPCRETESTGNAGGESGARNAGEDSEENDPSIVFAPKIGPRRGFLWR